MTTTPAVQQQPTPERFFNAVNAYQLTDAIKSAIDLEVFTAIAEGHTTSADMAKRCATFAELEGISKTAGFTRVELSAVELGRNRLVIAYR